MVYSVTGQGISKTAIIDGFNGAYGQVNPAAINDNAGIIYGRNANANFREYNLKELGNKDYSVTPVNNYQVKYLPEDKVDFKNINKMALLGVAYEDLGGKESVSVNEMNNMYNQTVLKDKACVDAYDINNDGKIDIAENAVSIIIKDMSGDKNSSDAQLDPTVISGKFTNFGEINSSFMLSKTNVEKNRALAKQIYDYFNLKEAKDKFLSITSRQ